MSDREELEKARQLANRAIIVAAVALLCGAVSIALALLAFGLRR